MCIFISLPTFRNPTCLFTHIPLTWSGAAILIRSSTGAREINLSDSHKNLNEKRFPLFVQAATPVALTLLAMPLAGIKRRKMLTTEKAGAHHALAAANRLSQPFEILAGHEPELLLDFVKK